MKFLSKNCWLNGIYFFIVSLVVISPALYNGYPLVFIDSASVITSIGSLKPLLVKPIGYSIFVRVFSMQASLWPVIFFQGLLVNLTIYYTNKMFIAKRHLKVAHAIIILLLVLFTGFGWYASLIMTEIFTPTLILLGFIYLFKPELKWNSPRIYLLSLLISFVIIVHYSHIGYMMLILAFMAVVSFSKFKKNLPDVKIVRQRLLGLTVATTVAVLFIMSFNYYHNNGFVITSGSNVFIMARLTETGILQSYLEENCDEKDWELCKIKDNLPDRAAGFIWGSKNAMRQLKMNLHQADEEFNRIVNDIFSKPKYLLWYGWEMIKQTSVQFFHMKIGFGMTPNREGSSVYEAMEKEFSTELSDYKNSLQNLGYLHFDLINPVFMILFGVSFLLIFVFFQYFAVPVRTTWLVVFIISGMVLNAAITANLANVSHRLQGRVSWLIVFLAVLLVLQWRFKSFKRKNI